jgi:hypothetical protein
MKESLNTMNRSNPLHNVPSEFAIGGVYMPPLLIASVLGVIAAVVTARLLKRVRLTGSGGSARDVPATAVPRALQ